MLNCINLANIPTSEVWMIFGWVELHQGLVKPSHKYVRFKIIREIAWYLLIVLDG